MFDGIETATEVTITARTESWSERANCRGCDPDLFFPARGDNHTLAAAKNVCASCEVRPECLDYAMVNVERHGVWGGLSEGQRRGLRRTHRIGHPPSPYEASRANCGTNAGYHAHRRHHTEPCHACRAAHSALKVWNASA